MVPRRRHEPESNDAAIVNTLVASRLWPGASAVGQRICVYCTPEHPSNWKRVIGVVSSASHAALGEPDKGNVYLAAGAMQKSVFLVVRTERPTGEMERADPPCDRCDRSQSAGIPERVHAQPDRGLRGRPAVHHERCSRSRAAWRWRCRRPAFTASFRTRRRAERKRSVFAWRWGRLHNVFL